MTKKNFKSKLYINDSEPLDLSDQVRDTFTPSPEKLKTVFDMLYFDGLTTDQIAAKLYISQEQVKQRITEAVKLSKTEV